MMLPFVIDSGHRQLFRRHEDDQMRMDSSDSDASTPGPDQWVDLYGNYMYRYALARLSDPEIARDLVQESLLAAMHAFKGFQGKSSIKTWLIAILKRKIVDHYRRARSRQSRNNIETGTGGIDQTFDEYGHWQISPNEWTLNPGKAYEQREFMEVLYQCISKLPSRLAEIFMLREFEDMSTKQICSELDISESNCWVMLYRARLQLRNCLETNWLYTAK
jgi:RNA polymerase sigma-70 factor (ECF subfamily)